jgi:hypothetical protein
MSADRMLTSIHNDPTDRCVDFYLRPDGRVGFKEFRRDPEDQGVWTLTSFDERALFATYDEALRAAVARVPWLGAAALRAGPFVP